MTHPSIGAAHRLRRLAICVLAIVAFVSAFEIVARF